jgi:hypothetical protein
MNPSSNNTITINISNSKVFVYVLFILVIDLNHYLLIEDNNFNENKEMILND